jgi:hypothetical protein
LRRTAKSSSHQSVQVHFRVSRTAPKTKGNTPETIARTDAYDASTAVSRSTVPPRFGRQDW